MQHGTALRRGDDKELVSRVVDDSNALYAASLSLSAGFTREVRVETKMSDTNSSFHVSSRAGCCVGFVINNLPISSYCCSEGHRTAGKRSNKLMTGCGDGVSTRNKNKMGRLLWNERLESTEMCLTGSHEQTNWAVVIPVSVFSFK